MQPKMGERYKTTKTINQKRRDDAVTLSPKLHYPLHKKTTDSHIHCFNNLKRENENEKFTVALYNDDCDDNSSDRDHECDFGKRCYGISSNQNRGLIKSEYSRSAKLLQTKPTPLTSSPYVSRGRYPSVSFLEKRKDASSEDPLSDQMNIPGSSRFECINNKNDNHSNTFNDYNRSSAKILLKTPMPLSSSPCLSRGRSFRGSVLENRKDVSSSEKPIYDPKNKPDSSSIKFNTNKNDNNGNIFNDYKRKFKIQSDPIDPYVLLQEIRSLRDNILCNTNDNKGFNHHTSRTPDQSDGTPTNIFTPNHNYSTYNDDFKQPSSTTIDAHSLLEQIRTLHDNIMKTIPQKILTHNVDSNLVKIPTILPSSSPLTRQHIKLKFPTITMTKSYTYQRLSRKTLQGRKRYEQMTKVSRKITRHSSFNLQTLLEAPHDSLNTFLIINK